MREVQASEAQSGELLGAVERGESVAIGRDGRRVARLAPTASSRRTALLQAARRDAVPMG